MVELEGAALCEREADIRVETRSGQLLRLAFQNGTGSMDQVRPHLLPNPPPFPLFDQTISPGIRGYERTGGWLLGVLKCRFPLWCLCVRICTI